MTTNSILQEIFKIGKSSLFEYLKIELISQISGEEVSKKYKLANYKHNLALRNSNERGKILGTIAHDLQRFSNNSRSMGYHLNN